MVAYYQKVLFRSFPMDGHVMSLGFIIIIIIINEASCP
jgi:hypothetical protein